MPVGDDVVRRAPGAAGTLQCDWTAGDAVREPRGGVYRAPDCGTARRPPAHGVPVGHGALRVWSRRTPTRSQRSQERLCLPAVSLHQV